jgi:hypothetical protein
MIRPKSWDVATAEPKWDFEGKERYGMLELASKHRCTCQKRGIGDGKEEGMA